MYILIERKFFSKTKEFRVLPIRVYKDMGEAMRFVKKSIRKNVIGTLGDYEEGSYLFTDSADDVGCPYPYYSFRLESKEPDNPTIDYIIIELVDGSVIEL